MSVARSDASLGSLQGNRRDNAAQSCAPAAKAFPRWQQTRWRQGPHVLRTLDCSNGLSAVYLHHVRPRLHRLLAELPSLRELRRPAHARLRAALRPDIFPDRGAFWRTGRALPCFPLDRDACWRTARALPCFLTAVKTCVQGRRRARPHRGRFMPSRRPCARLHAEVPQPPPCRPSFLTLQSSS